MLIWSLHLVLVLFIFFLEEEARISLVFFGAYAVTSSVLGYFLLKFLFETFAFRKIKLIYKFISETKDSVKDVKGFGSTETTLDDVNESVLAWAKETETEITNLKSLERYRKKYVGDISHELKTPIFTLQGYIHTLLEGGLYDENINKKYLERAMVNISRLETIVEDLEMINKLESEAGVLEIETFNIKTLIEDVYKDLEMQAREKNITFSFKPGASHSFEVNADRNKIEQVLINLLINSIKYGKQDGTTKVSFYDMEKVILVEISDNGIGMTSEDMKHVFDRFYRADKSRSRKEGGSGLGLAIVKHIMEAHNQNINVRSTLGQGSTFGITLEKA